MIAYIRKHKAAVICGIVSSLIVVYLLDPIFSLLSDIVVGLLSLLGDRFSNQIYRQAAELSTRKYAFSLILMLYGVVMSVLIGGVVGIRVGRSIRNRAENDEETEDGINQHTNKSKRRLKTFGRINSIILVGVLIIFGVVLAGNYKILTLVSDFQHHMNILAPYLDEQIEEEIISEWSLMKSKEDYDILYLRMDRYADQADVILPPNETYSLTGI